MNQPAVNAGDQRAQVVGVLLAGGQSRRMFADGAGSGDKGLLDIAGRPMLAHVIERLAPQVGALVLNANGDPGRFASFGLPLVADTVGGQVGPLAGVLAGMRWAVAHTPGAALIATASTDAPFVPRDLVERLVSARNAAGGGERIALARSGGHLHPVIGLWPVSLADDLEQALLDGVRKVLAWTDRHGTVGVDFASVTVAGEEVDPFFNANTPEELRQARQLLGR
ncbi:MAG: molybdenum cofactor guanylyltransferase MobA [Hyphomicrobiaceae bacterium]|nr:molybdenum cofactor guanylyltransferase MobA [Hyphomicrobiaceae bacterium]